MWKRNYLYDFGLSQDDPLSELRVLHLREGDRVLCIASAGEVPLELLVASPDSVKIDAMDIAENQLFLSNCLEKNLSNKSHYLIFGSSTGDPLQEALDSFVTKNIRSNVIVGSGQENKVDELGDVSIIHADAIQI